MGVDFGPMSEDRPPIPRPLERELFIEAGYRCAVPTCRAVAPLQIDHIEDWAKVREHKFENMIVLCANCHGRKGDKRGHIDRIALRQFKANLALLNHRYGEFERRILDYFVANPEPNFVLVPGAMDLLVYYLVADGYLMRTAGFRAAFMENYTVTRDDGTQLKVGIPSQIAYSLTQSGQEFIRKWQEAKPLESKP
jgi:HNH endonuclease